ncbi:AAA family ATPase [Shewanella sp. 1CM18E]|uniref:AAA family ATPase n=1 Tax=Shewanella sp. 1CM18E TaxID=2929169 RepID=UPI0020BF7379|nr:AAA family ATPase [Shewanella sp. 1CM18E]MCK8045328.1 AAA family ATPase [Shewanella sp. 1CM18E]
MKISNFSFLNSDYSKLAALAKQAESYVYSDPQTCAFKLRAFTELLVEYIYHYLSFEQTDGNDLFARLNNQQFRQAIPNEIQSKLHLVRKQGNNAVHNKADITVTDALWLVQECYFIGRWFIQTMQTHYVFVPDFVHIAPNDTEINSLQKDNEQLLKDIANRDSEVRQTQTELENIRRKLQNSRDAYLSAEVKLKKLQEFENSAREAANSFDMKTGETRKRISVNEFFSEVELTTGQQKAVNAIDAFLKSDNCESFILNGYAGTGKTFITKGIVNYLNALGQHCVLMAPTGKAAKVISEKTGQAAATIHRSIFDFSNMKLAEQDAYGVELAPLKRNIDSLETVYIIDESSMFSDSPSCSDSIQFGSTRLLTDFVHYCRDNFDDSEKPVTRKIIFIGDHAQLPPVGASFSPALNAEYLTNEFKLSVHTAVLDEVVRQKSGSGVMDNAMLLRGAIDDNVFNQLDFDCSKADIESLQSDEVIERYMQLCDRQIAKTKDITIIASSNAQVADYNRQCRQVFFPQKNELCTGDKLISVANHYREYMSVTNGEFGAVLNVLSAPETKRITFSKKVEGKVETVSVELVFRDVELGFRGDFNEPMRFTAKIVENLLYNSEPSLTSDESKALYVDFLNRHSHLKRKGAEEALKKALKEDVYFNAFKVKFGYAITCHKAQGSEWQHVLVKCSSHYKTLTKDYFRWLYTAITRTSSNLYVLDEPKLSLGGGSTIVGDQGWLTHLLPTTETTTPTINVAAGEDNNSNDVSGDGALNTPLEHLLEKVKAQLIGSGIEITEVRHHQYQELYVFKAEENTAEVQFNYNGKHKVSSINVKGTGLLQISLQHCLAPLQGALLVDGTKTAATAEFLFVETYLEAFHQRIVEVFGCRNINIVHLDQNQWSQRYTFGRGNETAVIDFYYNGKQQFKKVQPMPNLSSSKPLLAELLDMWSKI